MYKVTSYQVYMAPNLPTEDGTYYGKTPLLEQALGAVERIKETTGQIAFIICECSDGITRYYN